MLTSLYIEAVSAILIAANGVVWILGVAGQATI